MVGKETLQATSLQLRPGDDLIGSGRQREFDAVVVVSFHRRGDIECRELNAFRPIAAVPIISVGVKSAAYDRVFRHLLTMAVAKDQNRREFRARSRLWDLWVAGRLGFCIAGRGIRAWFCELLSSPETQVPIPLQLNH